ncbi:MAG: hypothetical protein ACYC2O_02965, partial [Microthrixaceae bacterium]
MTADTTSQPDRAALQLREVELGDEPRAWRDAGFDVGDDGRVVLGSTTLRCTGAGGGFRSWSLGELGAGELDGLRLTQASGRTA